MTAPKRKVFRVNTHTRRSIRKINLTELNTARVAGREVRIPRRLAKAYKSSLPDIEAWPRVCNWIRYESTGSFFHSSW